MLIVEGTYFDPAVAVGAIDGAVFVVEVKGKHAHFRLVYVARTSASGRTCYRSLDGADAVARGSGRTMPAKITTASGQGLCVQELRCVRLRLPFKPADGWRNTLDWYEGFAPYGDQAEAFSRLSIVGFVDDDCVPVLAFEVGAVLFVLLGVNGDDGALEKGKRIARRGELLTHALTAGRVEANERQGEPRPHLVLHLFEHVVRRHDEDAVAAAATHELGQHHGSADTDRDADAWTHHLRVINPVTRVRFLAGPRVDQSPNRSGLPIRVSLFRRH